MRHKNQEASHDAVSKAPTSSLLGASIFYSIILHCSTVKMLQKLYQKIFTKCGALSMHMTELLIGSTFKALGRVPICTLCNVFGVEWHQATIWQRLASSGCHDQCLGMHQPTFCSSETWSSAGGKVNDARSSQELLQPTWCISVPSKELHLTHLCWSFQGFFFRSVKSS